jgi:hypothetical protein
MSGRRSTYPSISLFSFQDIVTSVTAILILVVLILTLELISRKFVEAATSAAASTTTIKESVAELEELVARLQAAIPEEDAASQLRAPLPTTERDVRILRDQRERLLGQVEDARRIRDESRRLAEEAVGELKRQESLETEMQQQEQEAHDVAMETKKLNEANADERDRLEALEDELKARPKGETELVYRRPRDTSRQSWLLEVSEAGFVALRLGTGRPEPLGREDGGESRLAVWAGQLKPNGDYVLVLIRPSGIEATESVLAILKDLGIPHGTDFIGEGQEVHDGSAAPDEEGRGNGGAK